MPFAQGDLTEDEMNLALDRLNRLRGSNPCRLCGHKSFLVHPALIANRSDSVDIHGRHTRQPCVMAYCKNCGLADMFVASILGITPLDSK